MTQALTTTSEPVLIRSNGGIFKSKLRMQFARFELTPTKIVCYRKSNLFLLFGALGMILARSAKGKRADELELARIASVARGKFGLNKKILDVTMNDGSTHRLTIDEFDPFAARLRESVGERFKA